jgi:hypothetical protein
MKALHRKRLEKLATHLEKGKLGHDKFYFGSYFKVTPCGTVACALGECPTVFPGDWMMDGSAPRIVYAHSTISSAEKFFGLSLSATDHLFYPNHQNPKRHGGKLLKSTATRKQVAANIRAVLKHQSKPAKAKAGVVAPQTRKSRL